MHFRHFSREFFVIQIAKPSGFRDHDRQTQWVLEILIAKPSGFHDHDRQNQWIL